jgi:hypothetical protein
VAIATAPRPEPARPGCIPLLVLGPAIVVRRRHRVKVLGRIYARRGIPGVEIGTTITVEGMAIDHHGCLAIVNPEDELR